MAREAPDIALDALIDELARVYWEDGRAQVLVLRAGFPAQDLPRFTTPQVFWSLVIWGAAGSEIPDGPAVLEAIAGRALEEYPSNEMFRVWDRKPEGRDLGTRRGVLARLRREIIDVSTERNRHKHFFGREDVFAEMDAWVAARDSGWLLVTGSPGLGKSALMDRWLRRREAVESLTAFHFIRRGHLDWAEPQVVQRNLAAQIEVMFPDQRDAEADPTYRLEQLLGRVSSVLGERVERLVLLVDGLDEAMTLSSASKDNPIPKIFPLELPDRVFVVTASRPRYPHLSWLEQRTGPFEKLALDERVESNEGAVRAYWAALGPAMTSPLTDELVQAAIRGAEGNLLHVVKLRELWSKPGVVRTAKGVPRGFPGMVDELWQRTVELPEAQRKLVRDGLALICAARESLPLRVVEELLEWKEDQAGDELLPLAREMLLEESWDEVPAYRPFHESLRELVERKLAGRRGGSIGTYHRVLAEYAAWPVEGDEFRRSYALRHRVEHRVESGELDDAAKVCMDLGYLTAKACAEGVVAVERDIRLAAEARKDDETRERLTTLNHLVAASSHWAHEVPQALPALLHDRALTNAPEILGDLIGYTGPASKQPRLRHPLQIRGMSRILQGHTSFVNALAVLPDGRIVSGSLDETLRVWDVETGRTLSLLHGHAVMALAMLPDGRVVSGSGDQTVRVWDVEAKRLLATFHGHTDRVKALAVLPDGRVVSGSDDETLRVWDAETGRALAVLHGHEGFVNALAVLPGGRIVSGSGDQTVRVWDLESGRAVATLGDHEGPVNTLLVLPDGRVVSGSDDQTVRVWNVESGRLLATLRGHEDCVKTLAMSPEGHVVSGSGDHTLRVWDLESGQSLATLHGHTLGVNALAILPDGRVVSSSEDRTLRVWDAESRRPLAARRGHRDWVNAVAVLPDGRVVSGSDDRTLRVWDVRTGGLLATFHGDQLVVKSLAVLPDGRVVSGSNDNTLRVWDVSSGRVLATVYGDASFYSVACVDQHLIVAGDGSGNVWFIDLPDLPQA